MKLFQLIEIDMEAERKRITAPRKYNERQRTALLKLCDLFEAGQWKKCLAHVRSKKAFPYDDKSGYPEVEHIGTELSDVLQDLGHRNFFTQAQLLAEAREKLTQAKHSPNEIPNP